MKLIDNRINTLKEDLSGEIKKGSKMSIAAACFSIYAFQSLKEQLMVVKSETYVPKYVPSRFCHDFGAEKAKIASCQSEREK